MGDCGGTGCLWKGHWDAERFPPWASWARSRRVWKSGPMIEKANNKAQRERTDGLAGRRSLSTANWNAVRPGLLCVCMCVCVRVKICEWLGTCAFVCDDSWRGPIRTLTAGCTKVGTVGTSLTRGSPTGPAGILYPKVSKPDIKPNIKNNRTMKNSLWSMLKILPLILI